MLLIEFKIHQAAGNSLSLQELRTTTMWLYQDNRDSGWGWNRLLPEHRRVTSTPTSVATKPFHTILNLDPIVNRQRILKTKYPRYSRYVRAYVHAVPKHTEYISLGILKYKSQDRWDPEAKAKTSSIYYGLWIRSRGSVSCIYRDTWKENYNYKIIKVKGIEAGGLRIFQDHVPVTSHETRAL